jgi:tetratricopeptide (TPR) repeat protein
MSDDLNWAEFYQSRQRLHAYTYLEFAQAQAQPTPVAHAQIEVELPNLLQAADWLRSHEDRPGLLKLAALLWEESNFFRTRGLGQRAIPLLESACAAASQLADRPAECAWLDALSFVHWNFVGDYPRAEALYQQMLALAQQIDHPRLKPHAQLGLGRLYIDLGRFEAALTLLTEALQGYRQASDIGGETTTLMTLGTLYSQQGNWSSATEYLSQALVLAQVTQDIRTEADLLYRIGYIDLMTQNLTGAAEHFQAALAAAQLADHRLLAARSQVALGEVRFGQGDAFTAAALLEEALILQEASGDIVAQPFTQLSLGKTYNFLNEVDKSLAQLHRAYARLVEMRSATPAALAAAYAAWFIADNHLKRGDTGQARYALQNVLTFGLPQLADLRQEATILLQSLS